MLITLAAAELRAALDATVRVVERRQTIPILSNIKIDARQEGRIEITASDLDIEVRASAAAKVSRAGITTLPAAMLASIVGKVGKTAEITINLGSQFAEVTSGRSKWSIQTLPASDYPDMTAGDFPVVFTLPAKQLALVPARCSFAISTDETRYYLNGIYLHTPMIDDARVLRAVATDGHRLARLTLPLPQETPDFAAIVPKKAVGEIEKLAKAAGADETATIEISETKIRLTLGAIVLTSKLIDGTFPDYVRVVPIANDISVRLPAEALSGGVDRVSTLSSERGNAVKLSFAETELTLTCVNPDAGSAEEVITDINGTAEPMTIAFNARYVADALKIIDGDDIELLMRDPLTPAIVAEPDKAADFLIVLMPMRV